MKKFLALALAMAMSLTLVACGSKDGGSSAPAASGSSDASVSVSGEGGTVGIAMPTKSLERWNRDGSYLKEQFETAGYGVELKYSDNDVEQQNNDIAAMIADGVDLLIVAAIDGDSLSNVLGDAKDAGIPVISYDRLIMNTDAISYYVSFDNYTVGTLQGQFVIDQLGLDISVMLLWVLAVIFIYAFITSKTAFGRYFYAVGGNEKATKLSGINTKKVYFMAYASMSLLAGLSGLLVAARIGSVNGDTGTSFEMDAIGSCFIGGASAYGGSGTVPGIMVGAILLGVINQGMSIIGLDNNWQYVVKGAVLLVAVIFDVVSNHKTGKAG